VTRNETGIDTWRGRKFAVAAMDSVNRSDACDDTRPLVRKRVDSTRRAICAKRRALLSPGPGEIPDGLRHARPSQSPRGRAESGDAGQSEFFERGAFLLRRRCDWERRTFSSGPESDVERRTFFSSQMSSSER